MSKTATIAVCSLLLLGLFTDTALARLKPKQVYEIKWREAHGQIVISSVCARFRRGSLDYRQCRSYALDHFTQLCTLHTQKSQGSGGQARARHHRLSVMYCAAARKLP